MKTTLKIEELAQLILGIWLFSQLPYVWWIFLALILVPDIGILGYGLKYSDNFKRTHLGLIGKN